MSDTPVVAATLALQQAETIFNMDMDVVDGLKGVIRVLHQVGAVHAVSWCWPSVTDRPTENKKNKSASIGRRGPSGRMCYWGHWLGTMASKTARSSGMRIILLGWSD